MTVYCVFCLGMYEGECLEVIFATEELAKAWIAARGNSSRYRIEEREVHSMDPNSSLVRPEER